MKRSALRVRPLTTSFLALSAALAGAQVYPDSVHVDFGSLSAQSSLKSLYAVDSNSYSVSTASEQGSGNQVGAFLGTFPIPAGTVSAVAHVTTSVPVAGCVLQGYIYKADGTVEYLGFRNLPSGTSVQEFPITGDQLLRFRDAAGETRIQIRMYHPPSASGPLGWSVDSACVLLPLLPENGGDDVYGINQFGLDPSTLYAVDGAFHRLNTIKEAGTNNQIAAFVCPFRIPAGTPSATLHAVLDTDLDRTVLQSYISNSNSSDFLDYRTIASGEGAYDLPITGTQLAQYRNASSGQTLLQLRIFRPPLSSGDTNTSQVMWRTNQFVVYAAPSDGPAFATGLTAILDANGGIDLAWTDNANNETGYIIERKGGADADFVRIGTVLPAQAIDYQDTTVSPSTTYTYRVRATNYSGDSVPSNEASATTSAASGTGGTYALAVATSTSSIRFYWGQDSGAASYQIVRAGTEADLATAQPIATVNAQAGTIAHYDDHGLTEGQVYCYGVRAVNGQNVSGILGTDSHVPNSDALPLDASPAVLAQAIRNAYSDPDYSICLNGDATAQLPDGQTLNLNTGTFVSAQLNSWDPLTNILSLDGNSYSGLSMNNGTSTGGGGGQAVRPELVQGPYHKVFVRLPDDQAVTSLVNTCSYYVPGSDNFSNNYSVNQDRGESPQVFNGVSTENFESDAGYQFSPKGMYVVDTKTGSKAQFPNRWGYVARIWPGQPPETAPGGFYNNYSYSAFGGATTHYCDVDTNQGGFYLTMFSGIHAGKKGLFFGAISSDFNGPFFATFKLVWAKAGKDSTDWQVTRPSTVHLKKMGFKRLEAFVQKYSSTGGQPQPLSPAPDTTLFPGWGRYYYRTGDFVRGIAFYGGQVKVDGTPYEWQDIMDNPGRFNFRVTNYKPSNATVKYRSGATPLETTDIVAN